MTVVSNQVVRAATVACFNKMRQEFGLPVRPSEEFEDQEIEKWSSRIRAALSAVADDLVSAEREACAMIGAALLRPQQLRLQAGEMTAQEARTAKAVINYMMRAIRSRGEDKETR